MNEQYKGHIYYYIVMMYNKNKPGLYYLLGVYDTLERAKEAIEIDKKLSDNNLLEEISLCALNHPWDKKLIDDKGIEY